MVAVEVGQPCKYPPPASSRWRVDPEEDGGDAAELACTGRWCESCTAGVIADCVAVCCCPCAVVDILALALLKLPYAVARGLCARGRKRNKKKCQSTMICDGGGGMDGVSEVDMGNLVLSASLEEFANEGFSSTEAVWLELCEVGHLGFGRVSFTDNFQISN